MTERPIEAILSGRRLAKRFGATVALRGVHFGIASGAVTGLVGANGAGKSTLLKILAGAVVPDDGTLILDGRPITLTSVQHAARAGIGLVSQELNLFPALSVFENLTLGTRGRSRSVMRSTMRGLGLDVALDARLHRLSLGDQQLVEITRALLLQPRVLILDEPTSALRNTEKQRLHRVIAELRGRGVGIVYVSHFLEDLLALSDRLVILRDGVRVGEELEPRDCRLEDVVAAMLGDRPARRAAPLGRAPGEAAAPRPTAELRITSLRGSSQLAIEQWAARPGEVTGVTGLAGAGVEELFAILFGRARAQGGDITLPSGDAAPRSTAHAVASGVAMTSADRQRLGLMTGRSVADNACAVRSLVQRRDGAVLRRERLAAIARARCQSLGVKMGSVAAPVGGLSGGNQQKVVFAKWLEAEPSLVLLDDPTRGVDIGAKQDMHRIIRQVAADGGVVLMYSSDPRELIAVADRIVVFVDGIISHELSRDAFDEHDLVAAMNTGTRRDRGQIHAT